jgi:hypothetical protein
MKMNNVNYFLLFCKARNNNSFAIKSCSVFKFKLKLEYLFSKIRTFEHGFSNTYRHRKCRDAVV